MKTLLPGRPRTLGALCGVLACSLPALAVPVALNTGSGTYSQNFDALANTGTANVWTDDSTLPGWYSSRVAYRASAGGDTTGALHSMGATASTERALGSIGSNGTGPIGYGVRLENTSGLTLDTFSVSYTGEQWRNGGNASAQSLTFWYQIGNAMTDVTDTTPASDAAWTAFTALNFLSPITGTTSAVLDGNAAANRAVLTASLTGLTLAAGEELFLRWRDLNDSGSDHALAIDDFSVSWQSTPLPPGNVPEAGASSLLLGMALGGISFLRRRR